MDDHELLVPLLAEHELSVGQSLERDYGRVSMSEHGYIIIEIRVRSIRPAVLADAMAFNRAAFRQTPGAAMIKVRNSRPTADTVRVVGTAKRGLIPLHSLAVVAESAVAVMVANFGLRIGCNAIAASRRMFKEQQAAHKWLLARSRLHALDVRRTQGRPKAARHVQWP